MCRLLAQISAEPRTVADLILDSDKSLLKQSSAKRSCLQRDGWGIGWHDSAGKPLVVKSAQPIYKERAKLKKAAEQAKAKVVIAHVRAASNPLKLPPGRLLTPKNNQPFTDGHWLFAHNGTLSIPKEVTKALGPLKSKLTAENDSEVYFLHLLKHLKKAGSFHEAVEKALAELWDIWAGCKKAHPGLNGPYTGLNCLLTDGEELHAVCHQAAKGMALFGACSPGQPWGQMSFARRPGRLVIASEDLDGGAWARLTPPETLTASMRDGRLELKRRALEHVPQAPLPRPTAEAVS
jgi:predicted glutamine amidotransferase